MAERKGRPGAVRKTSKGPKVGTGGHGRKSLEGKGPTPKAEDRTYHPAGKRKAAAERAAARAGQRPNTARPARKPKSSDESEVVSGRNSVVEALRAKIPATALYVAVRIEMDDRVREAIALAGRRNIPLLEITRPELERLTGEDAVHQGIALKVPPYEYSHPIELLDQIEDRGEVPLIVAVDGITDPRNLGAILRSVAAFGGQAVVVPQRRSVGVTASAWKTSAGAAARIPVAMASNLTQTLKSLKERGLFVIGLDAGGDTSLPGLELASGPLVVVVGSEGKGLSRLVTETCDAVVSIPITASTESLNAGIAASVALYEIAKLRAERAAAS
ncbi:23S rRNA (guanosine(2251)-2'-O)-methyltransferase RlmB [Naasia sp. SYSU D00057]|uniref:23S rRNA (guanosine(2251)-2'-O)-methyltransferase RlmB n=1 Tax=Naasia sp. SYSU D00057 TaxID=2817380 RepID=UPI001B304591|nr:23S rRNA (guanosine(2251)-2'-O)-methyltransferase RlmB [Naasia sp. SYSU D00057]